MKTVVTAIVVAVPSFLFVVASTARVIAKSDRIEELEHQLRLSEIKLDATTRNLKRATRLMTVAQLAKMLEGATLDSEFHNVTRDI